MTIAEIKAAAQAELAKKDAKLQCMDFKGSVKIIHQDRSVFLLENAIMEEQTFGNFKLLLVWTEHCGNFFLFTDDLESWYYLPYEVPTTQERPEGIGSDEERTDDH